MPPEQVVRDVTDLRRRGWHMLSARGAAAFVRGDPAAERCCLVTSDDGEPADAGWVAALRSVECPGVTFVNVGRVDAARVPFYAALAASEDVTVEDHGQFHRKHFVSGVVKDWVGPSTVVTNLAGPTPPLGAPLCEFGSDVVHPRFDPDPAALELAADFGARSHPAEVNTPRWRAAIQDELERRGLGRHEGERFRLLGTFEPREAFERRARAMLQAGRDAFAATFGRAPSLYAYSWWEGSRTTDRILDELGYAASFADVDSLQPAGASPFGIPRMRADAGMPRPLRPELLPLRGRSVSWTTRVRTRVHALLDRI